MVYPDPNKWHSLFTDTWKYAWSAMLIQEYNAVIHGKAVSHQQQITYVSGLFQGSQLNCHIDKWDICYLHVSPEFSFYLADASITLRSDHTPLKRILQKTGLNAKANNWGSKLSDCNIQSKFLKGVKNTFADTISWLNNLDVTQPNSPEEVPFHD